MICRCKHITQVQQSIERQNVCSVSDGTLAGALGCNHPRFLANSEDLQHRGFWNTHMMSANSGTSSSNCMAELAGCSLPCRCTTLSKKVNHMCALSPNNPGKLKAASSGLRVKVWAELVLDRPVNPASKNLRLWCYQTNTKNTCDRPPSQCHLLEDATSAAATKIEPPEPGIELGTSWSSP